MYGKLFASTFTGSMVGYGPDVFAVWAYVIANAIDGQVELNPVLLSAVIGCPQERIAAAIEVLCAPDKNSRSQAEDGRRLVKEGSFAYKVVNHSIYRSILNESERREYNRVKQAERRSRLASVKKSNHVSMTVIDKSAVSAHTEAEAEAEAEAKKTAPQNPQKKELEDAAAAIYEAYPRKTARETAIKSILKAVREYGSEFILERTKLYAKAREGQDPQYTPHPATWFNQQRFNDDPAAWLPHQPPQKKRLTYQP